MNFDFEKIPDVNLRKRGRSLSFTLGNDREFKQAYTETMSTRPAAVSKKKKFTQTKQKIRFRRKGFKNLIPRPTFAIERKEVVSALSNSVIAFNNITQLLLNGIDQGTTNITRVGTNVTVRGIYIKLEVRLNTGNAATYCLRTVLDKQPNGAAFPVVSATVNGRYLNGGAADAQPWYHLERGSMNRYVTLSEETRELNPEFSGAVERHYYSKYIPCTIGCSYSGSGATITSIVSNSLYFIGYSDVTSANAPAVTGQVKLIYTDD